MMETVERAALLVVDKLAAGCAGHGEGVRAKVSIEDAGELCRRDRRFDLGLQGFHLLIGLLELERGLLQLLIGALQLLCGGLDPRVLRLELLDLYLERTNYGAVAFAILAQLAHLGSDFLESGCVGGVAVGRARHARQ